MQAIEVITDAYERLNRLSPGETLNADDAAVGFRRLNLLVDELSARVQFLYRSILTSAAQTGNITLGAGSWAAIPPGTEIVTVKVDGFEISPLTMQQYAGLYSPLSTGSPVAWAADGMSTIYLTPVPNGQTVQLMTLSSVTEFADQTTSYTVPPGYESALGAMLAVRLAPNVLGKVPAELLRAERAATTGIMGVQPAIVDTRDYRCARPNGNVVDGWR
jgi:hypothetical protein